MGYEEIVTITQSTPFIVATIGVWLLVALAYSLIGLKRVSGKSSKRFIETSNFLWGFLVVFFLNGVLLLLFLIFPIWALLIPN